MGFGTTKRLGFPLLVSAPLELRVRLFLLDERAVLLAVEDDKRVKKGWEGLVLDGPGVIGIEF